MCLSLHRCVSLLLDYSCSCCRSCRVAFYIPLYHTHNVSQRREHIKDKKVRARGLRNFSSQQLFSPAGMREDPERVLSSRVYYTRICAYALCMIRNYQSPFFFFPPGHHSCLQRIIHLVPPNLYSILY